MADLKPRLISYRVDLTPGLGGPLQRVNRVGSRYAIDVQMPGLDASCARAWLAARLKAEAENDYLRLTWPEPDGALPYDSVVVDGAGQAGTRLALRGFPTDAPIPAGRFFSILHEDGLRLYATTEDVVASDSGQAVLSIAPMLRRSPGDGYGVHFRPVLADVLADGTTLDWELQLKRWTSFSVTLTEFH